MRRRLALPSKILAGLDQADAEAATRRGAVTTAEANLRTAELTLKRLIVNGTDDPVWRATITPVDRPEFRSEPLDVETAVRKALVSRTDLEQARKTLDSNDIIIVRNVASLQASDFILHA